MKPFTHLLRGGWQNTSMQFIGYLTASVCKHCTATAHSTFSILAVHEIDGGRKHVAERVRLELTQRSSNTLAYTIYLDESDPSAMTASLLLNLLSQPFHVRMALDEKLLLKVLPVIQDHLVRLERIEIVFASIRSCIINGTTLPTGSRGPSYGLILDLVCFPANQFMLYG